MRAAIAMTGEASGLVPQSTSRSVRTPSFARSRRSTAPRLGGQVRAGLVAAWTKVMNLDRFDLDRPLGT